MRNTFYYLAFLFLFTACAKENLELDLPQDEPLFIVDVMKNGSEFLIEAGRDDFYLFTDNSLNEIDEVFSPYSEFAKTDQCTSECLESFSLTILNIPTNEADSYFNNDPIVPSKFNLKATTSDAGAVLISYINPQGTVYLTSNGIQEENDHFTITAIQPYLKNENGQDTKLIHADLDCHLYSGTGDVLEIKSGKIIIAVALP